MQGAIKTLILFSLFQAASAHAEIFLCKDANGRTLTSDRPIPECADRAVREYGKNGMIRKEIPAPLTPEQKREKLAQEEKKKADDAVADEQRRADRALLARYRNESDIIDARHRDSASLNDQIAQQKKILTSAEEEWKLAQAAAQKPAAKSNIALQNKAAGAAQKVVDARMMMQESQAELAQINNKYDGILRRYREISEQVSSK